MAIVVVVVMVVVMVVVVVVMDRGLSTFIRWCIAAFCLIDVSLKLWTLLDRVYWRIHVAVFLLIDAAGRINYIQLQQRASEL